MFKRFGIIACAGALCLGGTAFAQPIDNVVQDAELGKLTITGTLPAGGKFTVQVLKMGKKSDDLDGLKSDNAKNIVQTVDVFETENGDYNVDLILGKTAETGSYLIRMNGGGLTEPYEFTYEKYYNVTKIQELFKTIGEGDKDDIFKVIDSEENRTILGLTPKDLYGLLSDKAKDAVANDIYTDKSEIKTVEDLREYFKKAGSIEGIIYAESSKNSAEILSKYGADAVFSGCAKYDDFVGMNETSKSSVGERLIGKDLKNDKEKYFNEAVILAELENASGAADFKDILSENKEYFEDGALDDYLNMKDSSSYDSKIMAEISGLNSLEETADKIGEIIKKTSKKPSGGSGGSSGGSGGGIAVTTPAEPTSEKAAFTDMSEVSWAQTAVDYLYGKGIVNGKTENLFYPNDLVKREEFVKMATLAFNLDGDGDEPNFYDVQPDDWYYSCIVGAYKSGKIKGVSNEKFGVGEYITRQDMAVMIYRIIKDSSASLENTGVLGFTDKADISEYAREAVAYLRAAGVISGMEDGSFKPMSGSTRAQAACIIYKAVKFAEGGV